MKFIRQEILNRYYRHFMWFINPGMGRKEGLSIDTDVKYRLSLQDHLASLKQIFEWQLSWPRSSSLKKKRLMLCRRLFSLVKSTFGIDEDEEIENFLYF